LATTSWPWARLALAMFVSVAVRTMAVLASGVLPAGDSSAFLQAAATWSESHHSLSSLFSSYEGRSPLYIAFLGVVSSFAPPGSVTLVVVVVQAVMSAAVPLMLYAGVRLGGGPNRTAWVTWALALVSYELTRWNSYILTDPLLIDLSTAALVALVISLRRSSPTWSWVAGFAVFLALLVHGTAVAMVAAVLLVGLFWRPFPRVTVIAVLGALLGSVSYFALSPVPMESRGTPLDGVCTYLASGRVIWGMDEYRLEPIPEPVNDTELSPRQCIYRAVTLFPGHAAAVVFRKAAVYWMPFYRHYSPRHQLANIALLGIPLVLAAIALLVRPGQIRGDPLKSVPLAWVASFTAVHALTWIEGDQRFLAPVLPAVYVLAGSTAARLLDLWPAAMALTVRREWP
jgi:hypothetical protein